MHGPRCEHRWGRTPASFLWVAVIALCLVWLSCGCAPYTKTYIRRIHQSALVPAPGGPHAIGAHLPAGKLGLEGGFSGSHTSGSGETRMSGQPGHVVLDKAIRGRISYGVTHFLEIGMELEYLSASWGTPMASDVDATQVNASHEVWAGPHLRFLVGGDGVFFGGGLELSIGKIPYHRTIEEEIWQTEIADGATTLVSRNTQELEQKLLYAMVRTSLYTLLEPHESITVVLGGMLHNQPVFFGYGWADKQCNGEEQQYTCDGRDPHDLPVQQTEAFVTPFAAVTVQLSERLTLTGQFFVHAVGEDDLRAAAPLGGDLALRLSLL